MRNVWGIVASLAILLWIAGCQSTPHSVEVVDSVDPFADVAARVRLAAVEVLVGGRLEGSGWHADASGLIVSGAHVVHGRSEPIEVISKAAGRRAAKIVAFDRGNDLVLLAIEPIREPYPYLMVAAEAPEAGDRVYLFGAAQFRHDLVLPGTVARARHSYELFVNNRKYVAGVYVAGSSPVGTSGACWVNRAGEVVGNQCAFINNGGAPVGVAFMSRVDAIANLVAARKQVETATLAISIEELWERPVGFIKRFPPGTQGVVPAHVFEPGAAHAAGITREMVITHVDDKPIAFRDELLDAVRAKPPGDSIILTTLEADRHIERRMLIKMGKL